MKIFITIAATLIFTIGAFAIFTQTQKAQPQVTVVWEYKFEYSINEKKANELGAQGWELAGMTQNGALTAYVFKRQKK
jgi:hypothetical protein